MSTELTPQQRAQQAADDYTQLLVTQTQYSGNSKAGQKIFSVSSLGGELLQHWLSYKYGKKDKSAYGANTIGTIYQLGADSAVQKFNVTSSPKETWTITKGIDDGEHGSLVFRYQSAYRTTRVLENGWTISGEMDHIDHKLKVIIDNKVISGSAYKDVMKNLPDNSYNLQLAGYQWLLEPTYGRYEGLLSIVNKGGAAIRNDIYTTLHLDTHPSDIIGDAFLAETNALQFYIDNDMPPPQCDIFKFGKTKDIPNRCALYCDHNHHCPSYSPFKRERDLISALSIV
jgi:hypothetical protein